jgi:CPA2 family monovalent cation:H+ antiporter-2
MLPLDFILTLAGGFAAALVGGYITNRLGLSPIVGYLFAGIAVGPHTPGFVADPHLAEQLAEVGVILLMFGVGLQFHVEELLAVRRIAIPGALLQSASATILGALVGRAFGWNWDTGIVFGVALSVASTVVLVRVLADNDDLHTPTGHIAVGWLVVEDLLTVLVLVLMPAIFGPAARGSQIVVTVAIAIAKIGLLAVFTIYAGGRIIPWLLAQVAATRSRELFTLTVLVVALGIAAVSAVFFGASMALGAFLAGMVVGRSEFSVRAASEALPMRDAFAVLFFVSVGMLLDPAHLLRSPGLIAISTATILIGKPVAALLITQMSRQTWQTGLCVAAALAQIGEFSFIVSTLGNQLGVLPVEATQTLVAASILSITLAPIIYRAAARVGRWLDRRRPSGPARLGTASMVPVSTRHEAVVIGYGPVGRTVVRLLRENAIRPRVIEMNVETVRALREEGVDALYGDATRHDTLVGSGVRTAGTLIISVGGMTGVEETIRVARELNETIRILVRTANLREAAAMRSAGADVAFSGEGEVALAFTEAILQDLGATPEQIERQRVRVHQELGGT